MLTTWPPCIAHAHPNTKEPQRHRLQIVVNGSNQELKESLHYHRQQSMVLFAVKSGHRVLHALPAPAPTAWRTNCSGQGVPVVVHATLALTIEDFPFG